MRFNYNPLMIYRALQSAENRTDFPSASDREQWNKISEKLGKRKTNDMLEKAETALRTPFPHLSASLYLECERTGRREGYQEPFFQRRNLLGDLVLGECIEGKGRFLDAILDAAWGICEESSWVMPAHHYALPDMCEAQIDLGVAMTGLYLAEAYGLLHDQLNPELLKRIAFEVDRRILKPYLEQNDIFWLYNAVGEDGEPQLVNNWNAVCNAGVIGAAVYLERDDWRLSAILAKAILSLSDYLDTFDSDGGSEEGPGYWDYGFGYYALAGHLLERCTAGKITLFQDELIPKIACYPLKTLLSPGCYVNFSDAHERFEFTRPLLVFLSERLDIPGLKSLALHSPEGTGRHDFTWSLRDLFWREKELETVPFLPAEHDWFSQMMWMIARSDPVDPDGLVLAAKGGHNAESHNHNDLGNLIVHYKGESVIADLGSGRYTRQYFQSCRYDLFVPASISHSVPLVNGFAQVAGRNYAARLIEHQAGSSTEKIDDILFLDLKHAYPEDAGLERLERRIVFHRQSQPAYLELVDYFSFAKQPGTFENSLYTFGSAETGVDSVLMRGEKAGLKVCFDPQIVDVRVVEHKDVDLAEGLRDVLQVIFSVKAAAQQGEIQLLIYPV